MPEAFQATARLLSRSLLRSWPLATSHRRFGVAPRANPDQLVEHVQARRIHLIGGMAPLRCFALLGILPNALTNPNRPTAERIDESQMLDEDVVERIEHRPHTPISPPRYAVFAGGLLHLQW